MEEILLRPPRWRTDSYEAIADGAGAKTFLLLCCFFLSYLGRLKKEAGNALIPLNRQPTVYRE